MTLFRISQISLVLLLVGFYSCSESKIEQGEVQYELTYPYMEIKGFLTVIVPSEMTIEFKGTKMKTTISKGDIFETNIISDESNNYLAMYSDIDNKQLYCELTPSEIKDLTNSLPTYVITKTEKQDSLAGVLCQKYAVKSTDSLATFDALFTEAFAIQKGMWFSSYTDLKGFPMEYDIERYGMFTHAKAISFKEKEISDSTFKIIGDYKKVDFQTYEKESKEIFDLLVNW